MMCCGYNEQVAEWHEYDKCHHAFIVQNLLAATSTASMRVLIDPAACYTKVHTLAESVCQNCVLGRHANLCSIVVLHLPSLF